MLIEEPPTSPEREALFESDVAAVGFVMNLTRAWAWHPELKSGLFDLLAQAAEHAGLTYRDKGVLVTAMATTMGDSYCSLAWGTRLAAASDPATAAELIESRAEGQGGAADDGDERDAALAAWAHRLAADPNSATEADVARLRAVGFDDSRIAALTVFVSLRLAFSTVNDGLGIAPDHELAAKAPPEVRQAVAYGRPPETAPSETDPPAAD